MQSVSFLGFPVKLSVLEQDTLHRVTARPIYHTRVYVIEVAASNPALVGKLTMPRWPARAERRVVTPKQHVPYRREDITYIVYEDLYDLHRGLSHPLDRYEMNEVPRLTTALGYCQALHGVVLGLRKDNFQELIGRIESLVDQVVEAIGLQVENEEKRFALHQAVITRTGVDSLNRVNSSAACLRMLSAVGDLIHRESSIVDISEIYAGRRQAVRLALATLETLVLVVEDFLNQMLANWHIVRIRRREFTAEQLDQFVWALESISVKPFSTTFQHVVREFTTAARHIRAGRLDQAKTLLKTAASSMRLRRLRVQLEVVHYRISSVTHDSLQRKHAARIAHAAQSELMPLVQELSVVDTLGMVDFSSSSTLATLAIVQAALAKGDCTVAAENFRLALRTI